MEELLTLFFKGKSIQKNEDPYLNVYQFIEFALSKDSDQEFRDFMRKIKDKIMKRKDDEIRQLTFNHRLINEKYKSIEY